MYLGYDNGFPQGGMNDAGLAFDGFATGARPMSKQDGKRVFRRFLRELGGLSGTALSKGFKALIRRLPIEGATKFYDLRSSVSTVSAQRRRC